MQNIGDFLVFQQLLEKCEKNSRIRDENLLNFEVREVRRKVNLIDLVKSFPTTVEYLLAKIGFDTADN